MTTTHQQTTATNGPSQQKLQTSTCTRSHITIRNERKSDTITKI